MNWNYAIILPSQSALVGQIIRDLKKTSGMVADTKIAATPSAKSADQFIFIFWISNSSGLFFSDGVTMSSLIHALPLMKSMAIGFVKQA